MSDSSIPLSVLVPTKNDVKNLRRCLDAIAWWADEIIVVDSSSSDGTADVASSYGATVVQFHYQGGWPKKRQWALDNIAMRNEWVLLLDTDEILDDALKNEIAATLSSPEADAYFLRYRIVFFGRPLKYGDTELWKLSLIRRGKAWFECRSQAQDNSMCDMEVHEHVVCNGQTGRLKSAVHHENHNSLYRYIDKHNEYSNWEALVYSRSSDGGMPPNLFGNQAQRRRWFKRLLIRVPLFPIAVFTYTYLLRKGFLDGKAGFIYSAFRAIQCFHVQAKLYERSLENRELKT